MKTFFLSSFLAALLLPMAGAHAFLDVPSGHENKAAIYYLDKTNVINGNPDKTFAPERGLNRAEFAEMVVTGLGFDPDVEAYNNCFLDVKKQWFAAPVCFGKEQGWWDGFPDGTYGPEKPVLDVEQAKMTLNAYGFPIIEDVDGDQWYSDFMNTMLVLGLSDPDDVDPGTPLDRGDAAEKIYRSVLSKEQGFDRFDFEDEKAWLIEDLVNSIGEIDDPAMQELVRNKIASLQDIKSEEAFFAALEELHKELAPYYREDDFDFFDEFEQDPSDFAAAREFILADLEEEISLLDDEAASFEIIDMFAKLHTIADEDDFFALVNEIEMMIDQYYHNSGEPYWIDDEGPVWMEEEFEGEEPWWTDFQEWEPEDENHDDFWDFDDNYNGNPWEQYDDPWHDEFFQFEGSEWDRPFGVGAPSSVELDEHYPGSDFGEGNYPSDGNPESDDVHILPFPFPPDGSFPSEHEEYPYDEEEYDYPYDDPLPDNFDDLSPEEQDAILREIYGEDSFPDGDEEGDYPYDEYPYDDYPYDEEEYDYPYEDSLPDNFDQLSPEEQDAILREIYGEDSFPDYDEEDYFDPYDEYDAGSYPGY